MNLDNMNSEHRTSSIANQRLRPNRRTNTNPTVRCCSFCRHPGHNINLCNDQRLHDFENLCRYKKLEFQNDNNPVDSFQTWIYEYWNGNKQVVKAFAVSKCGALTRHRTFNLIESIMAYFYRYDFISGNIPPPLVPDEDEDESYEDINNRIERNYTIEREYTTFIMIMRLLTSNVDSQPVGERKFAIQCDLNNLESEEICQCNICFEDEKITNFVKLNCNHEFCKECIKKTLKSCNRNTFPKCAFCREDFKNFIFKNDVVQNEFSEMII
jgi:hypothetical protein